MGGFDADQVQLCLIILAGVLIIIIVLLPIYNHLEQVWKTDRCGLCGLSFLLSWELNKDKNLPFKLVMKLVSNLGNNTFKCMLWCRLPYRDKNYELTTKMKLIST